MRINLQVSLIALLITMGSLSQPSWSMEQEESEVKSRGEKRKNLENRKDEKEQPQKKRRRKFNRKRQIPPTGFNDLPPEMQAEVWAHALAQGGISAYRNLSFVNNFSRACTQNLGVLRRALSLAEFRIVWDEEQDKLDQANQSQENQVQDEKELEKQEQRNIKPTLLKLGAIQKAPYSKSANAKEGLKIIPLLTAMQHNPTSHALVYHLASYAYEMRQKKELGEIVFSENLDSITSQMQKTKDFLASGLLEDRKKERPFDSLKYEAFLKLFYVFETPTEDSEEEDPEEAPTKDSEEKCPLEGELKEIENRIKGASLNSTHEINELKEYNPAQLRLIALLDPIIKEKQYLSLLDWLAGQGDLESLRSIMARCRPVVSWYRRGDDPTNFYQETNSSSDEKSAYFWYSQIMENRKHPLYTEAQYWLGMLYLNPIKKFILPNDAKGIQLVQEAAKAGEPRACLEIGKRYISGSLVEQDIDEGIQWLEKAARLGEPSGLYYLYEAYSIGEVIPQDQEKAEAYLDKALAKNDPSAIREKEIRLHQRERQRKLAKAPLPQLGDSLMAPAGFPGWPSEQAPMGESHPAAEVPYSATLQPGHFHSIPDLQAKETSSMLTDFQAEANNLDAPTLEDFSTLDELFGDISLPEDIINSLLLPQEDRDEGSGN